MNLHGVRMLVTAVGLALGTMLLPGTGWADSADAIKPVVESATLNASPKVLAGRILSRWAPVAEAVGVDMVLWREQYSTQFSSMSAAALRIIDSAAPVAGAEASANYAHFTDAFRSAIMRSYTEGALTKTNAKLGSATTDQVFLPITPCRIVDTRNVGGPISFGTAVNYYFYSNIGSYNWSSQGGVAGNASTSCPLTVNPNGGTLSAAMVSISVVSPTAAGNWIIWGGANPIPTSSALLWQAGQNLTATTVIPWGGRSGVGPGGGVLDFAVYYNGPSGNAHFVADVVGYFTENKATALDCVNVTGTGTACPPGDYCNTTAPGCTTGYTRTGTFCSTTFTQFYLTDVGEGSCYGRNFDAATQTITATSRCCRVPGQ